ncbi:MAG: hypothetical protein H7Z12_01915 [Rhodospirillaceae bacterium]|nr:hypothetical protein [Rhodospirillales bacterium]
MDPDNHSTNDDQLTLTGTKLVIPKDSMANVSIVDLICRHLPDQAQKDFSLIDKPGKCTDVKDVPENLNKVLSQFAASYGAQSGTWSAVGDDGTSAKVVLNSLRAYIPELRTAVAEAQASASAVSPKLVQIRTEAGKDWPSGFDNAAGSVTTAINMAQADVSAADTHAAEQLPDRSKIALAGSDVRVVVSRLRDAKASAQSVDAMLNGVRPKVTTTSALDEAVKANTAAITSIDKALAQAELANGVGGSLDDLGKSHRTAIQETIILVADRRCEIVKQVITSAKAESSFISSMLSTVTGLTGALVSDSASRYFAGAAGGASAIGAAWDNAYFKGQATDLILHGINTARGDSRAKLIVPKRSASLAEYPLEEAIGHALQYNAECSIPAALHAVNAQLQKSPNVDAIAADRLLATFKMQCAQKAIAQDAAAQRNEALKACTASATEYEKLLTSAAIGDPPKAKAPDAPR